MKSILEYINYRKYILDFYTERKTLQGFTWRDFAKLVGFSNPVYLKQVCDGRYNLGKKVVDNVARAMNLAGVELTYFKLLVEFAHAKTEGVRQKAFEDIRAIISDKSPLALDQDSFKYFESWKNPVIREVAASMPGAKASEIAEACLPKITASEVIETLHFLLDLGLLQKNARGEYFETKKIISMKHKEAIPVAAKNMQLDMGRFALDAIESVPLSERDMSGLTMGISKDMYKRVVAELADFRRRIISIVAEEKADVERVYRMNLQFFPLTKNLRKKTTFEEKI